MREATIEAKMRAYEKAKINEANLRIDEIARIKDLVLR